MLQKQKGFNQDQRFRDIINALELCIIVLKTDKKKFVAMKLEYTEVQMNLFIVRDHVN